MTRILTYEDLRPLGIDATKNCLWRHERLGLFPRRVKVSPGKVGWVADEVERFLKERISARDAD